MGEAVVVRFIPPSLAGTSARVDGVGNQITSIILRRNESQQMIHTSVSGANVYLTDTCVWWHGQGGGRASKAQWCGGGGGAVWGEFETAEAGVTYSISLIFPPVSADLPSALRISPHMYCSTGSSFLLTFMYSTRLHIPIRR